ncbi:MAG: hypothetical protein HOK98_04315 [Rhodospirillaceae bacterium]|jgi:hypothetical protein|nr:hypothetical protein [Rhodospirillaceae bacterium]MBT5943214.1 hypothetical protein [Rhodospirillaceae bacterium]MBT6403980.1 hypothetical protein [Rhodospirillaceae bacterium]MBT6535387.1 hypothetical protein [Rhodospirillaceae bacterium]MBT7362385.1 hypothetical protein [Rhodospirillaceae bacterium]
MSDRNSGQPDARLLYFDEQPVSCMRAIDAADDIRLPIQTVSHPKALHDACRTFGPTAVLAVLRPGDLLALRVIAVMSVVGPRIPLLVAGDVDISRDRALRTKVKTLGLDVRGSVRLGGSLRDLQLALLCAIAGLHGEPGA